MWNKKAPSNMDVPQLPSQQQRKSETMKTQGDLFPVNLSTPHSIISDGKQVGRAIEHACVLTRAHAHQTVHHRCLSALDVPAAAPWSTCAEQMERVQ